VKLEFCYPLVVAYSVCVLQEPQPLSTQLQNNHPIYWATNCNQPSSQPPAFQGPARPISPTEAPTAIAPGHEPPAAISYVLFHLPYIPPALPCRLVQCWQSSRPPGGCLTRLLLLLWLWSPKSSCAAWTAWTARGAHSTKQQGTRNCDDGGFD